MSSDTVDVRTRYAVEAARHRSDTWDSPADRRDSIPVIFPGLSRRPDTMNAPEPRIDAYIAKSADFARPILTELRARVHAACPDVQEAIKWGAPGFTYKGKLLAMMAAFKQHAAFNLWHGAEIVGTADEAGEAGEGMGQFGRLTRIGDLPGKRETTRFIREVMKRIDAGVTRRVTKSPPKPPAAVPGDLLAALGCNAKARATFDGFPPSKQREYIDWITEAKRETTRKSRLDQSIEWLAEGKARHWKYQH
jgi:uncharacterized protein YdeI (YjbR/CyaY-like superfamily)